MKIIKQTLLIAFVLLAFNCSTEDTNNPIEEQNAKIDQTPTRGGGGDSADGNYTIYIKWMPNTPEGKKQALRDSYQNFISFERCISSSAGGLGGGNTGGPLGGGTGTTDAEVWTMSPCGDCHLNSTPVEDDDDVERAVYGATCPR